MYIVTVINKGSTFFLRGTTWAFRLDRADKFASLEAAQESIQRAEKFMTPAIKKAYRIECQNIETLTTQED